MDAYEASRIVFSRIQSLDPDNAAHIMGLLLLHHHADNHIIRLALAPDALLRSLIANDLNNSSSPVASKPCLYYARGYCKNGTACKFLHAFPDDTAPMLHQDLLLRSKTHRLMPAAAAAFPFSPTASMPASPSASAKCLDFLLQQHSDNQRAVEAAALMLAGDDAHKFTGRSRFDRVDFMNMMNPSSRQIYLTFPADSTFREEDVSNYFSIYGPVQDVRIPYQQKRMFGFVTFVYPETVKLILAKGNPHFICDARVLVKPYKEKGKVPEKYRSKPAGDRGDFSGCSTPTGLDSWDSFELQQLGTRMLHGNNTTEMLIRRKLEEQQQAAELQQAIELQSRRLMGLQLLDLKSRNFNSHGNGNGGHNSAMAIGSPTMSPIARSNSISPDDTRSEGKRWTEESSFPQQRRVNVTSLAAAAAAATDKEESTDEASPNADSDFQESSVEHNLPDSPFASPTAAAISAFKLDPFSISDVDVSSNDSVNCNAHLSASPLLSPASSVDMAAAKSFFLPVTRISSDRGAIGM